MSDFELYGQQELLLLSFFTAFLAWLGLSAYVIVTRAIHDARTRRLRRAEALLEREAPPSDETLRAVDRLLSRLPRSTIERAAANASTPGRLAAALARFLVARGERKFLRAAESHRSERTRWRRVDALRILARADHSQALALLNRAALDPDDDIAGAAVRILGTLRERAAADALLEAMRRRTHSASQIATRLVQFTNEIPEEVRALLRERDPHLRFWGANLVARDEDLPALERELAALTHDEEPSVRAAAIETLARVGGGLATRAATGLLADPVPYVRAHAARALGDMDGVASAHLVAPLLADRDWWVRSAAKHALVVMRGIGAEAAVPYLDHPDRFARNGAAEILQDIGFVDALVLDTVDEPEPGERTALLRKVAAAGGSAFVSATAERLQSRPEALRALDRVRPDADQSAA